MISGTVVEIPSAPPQARDAMIWLMEFPTGGRVSTVPWYTLPSPEVRVQAWHRLFRALGDERPATALRQGPGAHRFAIDLSCIMHGALGTCSQHHLRSAGYPDPAEALVDQHSLRRDGWLG